MLRIEVRFPLGVYHALAPASFGRAEWPPSPVRLIGALLAATHESDAVNIEAGRAILEEICAASPPELIAPKAAGSATSSADGSTVLAQVRGASRWAPRNREASEAKKKGISFRRLGGEQTEVFKGGTVIGDLTVGMVWGDISLTGDQLEELRRMADEVTFVGTSRSPVVVSVHDSPEEAKGRPVWRVAPAGVRSTAEVRVPTSTLLAAFDTRFEARRATGKKPIQSAGHVANVALGSTLPYVPTDELDAILAEEPFAPGRWGDMLILALNTEPADPGIGSDFWPNASASYLVARAFRSALLNSYGSVGSSDEAPPILRGHSAEPHAAFIPLPHVGTVATKVEKRGKRHPIPADGLIRGIAIVLPHEDLVPDVAMQRLRVVDGLHRLVLGDEREPIRVPGAGRIGFKLVPPETPGLRTLREATYRGPSQVWETVTPVVHAHRRTSSGPRGTVRQVNTDCSFAGLPEPLRIEVLKDPPFAGSPPKPLPASAVPPDWRSSMTGPSSHLRLEFPRPIEGPVLLGRAAHFGLGLCRPIRREQD